MFLHISKTHADDDDEEKEKRKKIEKTQHSTVNSKSERLEIGIS